MVIQNVLVKLDGEGPVPCSSIEIVPVYTILSDSIEFADENAAIALASAITHSEDGKVRLFLESGGALEPLVKIPPHIDTNEDGELVFSFRSRPRRAGEV